MDFSFDIGTALVGGIGFYFAIEQIKKLKEQITIAIENQKMEALKVVLEIETQMNSRKLEFDKASMELRKAEVENFSNEKFEIFEDFFNTTKESYFNTLERLCYCIDKNYINDKDWKSEYRNILKETIEEYENDFGPASSYKNIIKINIKWQSE